MVRQISTIIRLALPLVLKARNLTTPTGAHRQYGLLAGTAFTGFGVRSTEELIAGHKRVLATEGSGPPDTSKGRSYSRNSKQ